MDLITIVLIVLAAVLGLGGTLGTYWKLSQKILLLEALNKELKEKLAEVERKYTGKLEETRKRVSLLEELVKEYLGGSREENRGKFMEEDKRKREDDEYIDLKIFVLYRQGKSIREIARELGLSKSTVHRRLKKLLEKRDKKARRLTTSSPPR